MLSRRDFLRNTALVAAGIIAADQLALLDKLAPRSLFAAWPTPPKLWGDGIHDDTAALQWLMDSNRSGGHILIPEGHYRISDTLYMRSDTTIMNSVFTSSVDTMLDMTNAHRGMVNSCWFRTDDFLRTGLSRGHGLVWPRKTFNA